LNHVYSYARPWEQAYVNAAAIRPDWRKNVATAAFASLFAAILVVLGLEFMDQTVKTASDVEGKVSGSTIGFVPRLKLTDTSARGLCLSQNSFAADSLRNLQVRLDLIMGVRRPGQAAVVVVTSPLPGEGKSFLSANIASFFASSGQNVLLVDADFRKAMLSASHRCHGKKGLGDALVSGVWNQDTVIKTDVPGCNFLPSGTQGEKGLRHLNPGSMDGLLKKMKTDYDVIVIDTAPVLAMADVCILAGLSDVTLLTVRSRRSKFVHVQRASGMLHAAKAKSVNVVVNAVEAADAKSEDYYFAVGSYGVNEVSAALQAGRDAT
jgi:capsular exopolysaccharide synthesis family protein